MTLCFTLVFLDVKKLSFQRYSSLHSYFGVHVPQQLTIHHLLFYIVLPRGSFMMNSYFQIIIQNQGLKATQTPPLSRDQFYRFDQSETTFEMSSIFSKVSFSKASAPLELFVLAFTLVFSESVLAYQCRNVKNNTLKFQPKISTFYNWTCVHTIWKCARNTINVIRLVSSVLYQQCFC